MNCRSVALFLLMFPAVAAARDREFDEAVRVVEQQFGAHRVRIPLAGVGLFATHFTGALGAGHVKLAVFESVRGPVPGTPLRLPDFGHGWQPIVRVRDRAGEEVTAIYARPQGEWLDLLLLTVEPDNATVVKTRVNPARLIAVENLCTER